MDMEKLPLVAELMTLQEQSFNTVQAQLAVRGIELHRVTNDFGREAYTVNVRGQLRTLDHLPQVVNYARSMGVVMVS